MEIATHPLTHQWIGAYRNAIVGTVGQVRSARTLGTAGVVLFSYNSMARSDSTTAGRSYLRAVGDRAFTAARAAGR